MVLGILGAIAGATAIPMSAAALPNAATSTATSAVGVSQGGMNSNSNNGQRGQQPDPNDPRLAKFTLRAHCDEEESSFKKEVHRKQVVLRKGKVFDVSDLSLSDTFAERFLPQLYLDSTSHPHYQDGHPFSGFFLDYPSAKKGAPPLRGLVSTISKDPPELNWIYVDKDSLELKYGGKSKSTGHVVGPWDWTHDQKGMLLESWEGFVAMQAGDEEGGWLLCYDRDDNHLGNVRGDRKVVEIELDRRVIAK